MKRLFLTLLVVGNLAYNSAMASKECFIYGLRDPRTQEIRYVGQSSTGMKRPRRHMQANSLASDLYSARWLRTIGAPPEIVVLERVDRDDLTKSELQARLDEAEIRWIAIGRAALGPRLTNATAGGDGAREMTPEAKEKHRAALRAFAATPEGRKLRQDQIAKARESGIAPAVIEARRKWAKTPEGRACWEASLGKARTPEAVEKMAATKRAYAVTPEGRAQVLAMVEASRTPETRAKMVAAHRPLTPEAEARRLAALQLPETRAKMSVAQRAQFASEAGVLRKARMSAAHKTLAATPEGRARTAALVAKSQTPEARAKVSATRREQAKRPEVRARLLAALEKAHAKQRANRNGA